LNGSLFCGKLSKGQDHKNEGWCGAHLPNPLPYRGWNDHARYELGVAKAPGSQQIPRPTPVKKSSGAFELEWVIFGVVAALVATAEKSQPNTGL
jgi:hypothetical protein